METSQSLNAAELENHIKCEIKDIQEFKWCLDSVKFPIGPKKFNVSAAILLMFVGCRIFRADFRHHPQISFPVWDHHD